MSKLTSLITSRLRSVGHGQKEKQKGASALEYIVLAAVIVIAVAIGAYLIAGGDESPIDETFKKIEQSLTNEKPTRG